MFLDFICSGENDVCGLLWVYINTGQDENISDYSGSYDSRTNIILTWVHNMYHDA